jgi:hypothetical protein
MPEARSGPSQSLFEEPNGMLQIKAPDVGSPQKLEIRFSGTIPPQPQLLGLAAPLTAR